MFAFLALAGDLGATVSPTMVGSFAELAGGNLKTGLLAATVFPVVLVIGLLILQNQVNKAENIYSGTVLSGSTIAKERVSF